MIPRRAGFASSHAELETLPAQVDLDELGYEAVANDPDLFEPPPRCACWQSA